MNKLGVTSPLFAVVFLTWDYQPPCFGQDKQDVVAELIKRLDDRNVDVSSRASDALIKLGEKAVPALIEEMKRPAAEGRGLWVTFVLGEIGSSSVVPLTRELDNPNAHVRLSAIDGLVRVGAPAKAAVPAIGRLLKDPNQYVRGDAAFALGELCDERAIEGLIKLLKGELDRDVRQAAVTAIGKFGAKAKEAIPVLIEIVANPVVDGGGFGFDVSDPRNHAAFTLAAIGPASVTPLADVLGNSKHPRVARRTAGSGLVQLGSRAAAELPRLIKIVDDPDPDIRETAIWVLGALGPKAADALPRLLNILSEPSARLQLQSASAIHAIDRKHKAVVPALIRCLRDKDEIIRVRAAIELGYVGADAVGDVIPLLKDEDERVRRAAADALAGIGPKASPAIPALRAALKDKDEGVRESAGDAIKAIEAKSNGSR